MSPTQHPDGGEIIETGPNFSGLGADRTGRGGCWFWIKFLLIILAILTGIGLGYLFIILGG